MLFPKNLKEFLHLVKEASLAHLLFIEIVFGLFWNIFSLYLFAHLTKNVLQKEIISYDQFIATFIYSLRSPLLTKIMFFFTNLGNTFPVIFLAILIILFLIIKNHRQEAFLFCLALILGDLLTILLKIVFEQPRPQISPLLHLKDNTYPSGHAMNNLVLYGLLAFFVFRFTRNKKLSFLAIIIAVLMIGLIGFSRIYLGVHYPSDVLAGYLAGFWLLVTILIIDKTLTFRHGLKTFHK